MKLFELLGTIALAGAAEAQQDIDDTTNKASNFGENLKKGIKTIGKWGIAIGTAAVGATTAMTNMAKSSAATADNVDKMSQKIGISREAYQELDFICSQSGTSVDNLQMGMKQLTNQMQAAQSGTKSAVDAFGSLGVSIYDSNGNLKDQETMMWEALSALQSLENQTEKAALANDLFGRSGSELMPLLNGAAGSIDKMKQQAHDLGLVLDDELIDNGVEMTDTMDQMKRAMGSLTTKLGGALMPIVTKLCNFLIKNMPNIEKIFNQLSPVLEGLFDNILPVIMDLVNGLLPVFSDLLNQILPIFSELTKSILPIFVDIFESIVPPFSEIVKSLLPVLQNILSAVVPLFDGLLSVLRPVLDVVSALITPIANLATGLTSVLADAFSFLSGKTSEAVEAAQEEAAAMRDMRDAANEARDAIDKKAEKELANVSTVEGLWKELQTLANEQGIVADKDKARADFITNQLSEALGYEITWTGNQIQNYKDLQTEIDNTIEKKKAEILLSASEEKYKLAVQGVAEAEKDRADKMQKTAEAWAKVHELEEKGIYGGKKYNEALEIAQSMQEAYGQASLKYKEYQEDIAEYEEAQTLILQGHTDKAIELLNSQGNAFKNAEDLAQKSKEEQLAILGEQLEESAVLMASNAEMLEKLGKDCTEEQRKVYERSYKQSKEQFEKAAQEYEKAGGEIGGNFIDSISSKMNKYQFENLGQYMVQNIKNGVEANEIILYQEMAKLWKNATAMSGSITVTSTSATPNVPQMATGGVLKKGQIGFLEGDGDEAVVPLEKNTGWISKLAEKINNSGGGDVVDKLDELIKAISSMNIVLDTGTMVGEMAPAMDAELGEILTAKERGR